MKNVSKEEIFNGVLPCPKCGRTLSVDFIHNLQPTLNVPCFRGYFFCSKCDKFAVMERSEGKTLKLLIQRAKKIWNKNKRPTSFSSPCGSCQEYKTFKLICGDEFFCQNSSPCKKCEWRELNQTAHK